MRNLTANTRSPAKLTRHQSCWFGCKGRQVNKLTSAGPLSTCADWNLWCKLAKMWWVGILASFLVLASCEENATDIPMLCPLCDVLDCHYCDPAVPPVLGLGPPDTQMCSCCEELECGTVGEKCGGSSGVNCSAGLVCMHRLGMILGEERSGLCEPSKRWSCWTR